MKTSDFRIMKMYEDVLNHTESERYLKTLRKLS